MTGRISPLSNRALAIFGLFFLPEPVAFRRVYGLEAYSRTSRESNHHRQSVSAVKNDALPTEPRGHLALAILGHSPSTTLTLWVMSRALKWFYHHLLRVFQCLLQMWRQHFHYIHRPAMFYARQAWRHLGQGKRHRFLQHLTSVTYLQVVYGMPPIFLRRSRDSGPLTFINERFHLFPQCIQGLLLCRCGLATCAWPFAPRLITIKMVQGDHN